MNTVARETLAMILRDWRRDVLAYYVFQPALWREILEGNRRLPWNTHGRWN